MIPARALQRTKFLKITVSSAYNADVSGNSRKIERNGTGGRDDIPPIPPMKGRYPGISLASYVNRSRDARLNGKRFAAPARQAFVSAQN